MRNWKEKEINFNLKIVLKHAYSMERKYILIGNIVGKNIILK